MDARRRVSFDAHLMGVVGILGRKRRDA